MTAFSRRDKLTLLVFAVLGLLGVTLYVLLYHQSSPTASLDLKISREQAVTVGDGFLRSLGFRTSGYTHAVIFDVDDSGKAYLERNLGLAMANRLAAGKASIWYWTVRWFKPGQKEEFTAYVDPLGTVTGFSHTIPEKRLGKNVSNAQAEVIALGLIRSVGLNPANYRLVSHSTNTYPLHKYHDFEWEQKGFQGNEASNRISVEVAGSKAWYFTNYVHTPEKWDRKVQEESAKGGFLYQVAGVGWGLLSIGMLLVLILAIRARVLRWRYAIPIAWALIAATGLSSLNSLSLAKIGYDTSETLGSFHSGIAIGLIEMALATLCGTVLLGSTGDAMQRWAFPGKTPPSVIFTWHGLRSREFLVAGVAGLCVGMMHLGYTATFYALGIRYFHVWMPAEIPYSNMLSTSIPWAYPLMIGLTAALNEELTFRLFAISALKRCLRATWPAVLISAATWAFLHSTYPQQPPYIRGIEVSVIGIAYGLVYLRFGIVATVIAHYTVDAVLSGTVLLQSSNIYFRISGLIVMALMVLPLLPSIVAMLTGFKQEAEPEPIEGMEATDESPDPDIPLPESPAPPRYRPPSRRGLWARAAISVVAVAILAAYTLHLHHHTLNLAPERLIDRGQAAALAQQYMTAHDIDTSRFISYTEYTDSADKAVKDYVKDHLDVRRSERLLRSLHDQNWHVCWFKPMSPEGHEIWLDPDGRFYAYRHNLSDDAHGARLSAKEARRRAEAWASAHGVGLSDYRLTDTSVDKLTNRTDYTFTWSRNVKKLGKAAVDFELTVAGDEVMSRNEFISLPDDDDDDSQTKTTARQTLLTGALGLLGSGWFILLIVAFITFCARRKVDWRLSLTWALLPTVCMLFFALDALPTFFSDYENTSPLSRYVASSVLSHLFSLAGVYIASAFLIGLADAAYRMAFPGRPSFREWLSVRGGPGWRARAYCDGVTSGYTGMLVIAVIVMVARVVSNDVSSLHEKAGAICTGWMDCFSPLLGMIPYAISVAAAIPVLAALMVSVSKLYVRRVWIMALLVGLMILLCIGSSADSWSDLAGESLVLIAGAALSYQFVKRWFGHNAYAYLVAPFSWTCAAYGMNLLILPNAVVKADGMLMIVFALIPGMVALYLRFSRPNLFVAEPAPALEMRAPDDAILEPLP